MSERTKANGPVPGGSEAVARRGMENGSALEADAQLNVDAAGQRRGDVLGDGGVQHVDFLVAESK